jgi:Transcriptional regulator, AbiEi antitoxin
MQPGTHGTLTSGVYVVKLKDFDLMNIGYSHKLYPRLVRLETSLPFPVDLVCCLEGGPLEEQILHHHFHAYHRQGQWFDMPAEYQGALSLLAADCTAILHGATPLSRLRNADKPPPLLRVVQRLTDPPGAESPSTDAHASATVAALSQVLPSPFTVREIAAQMGRHPSRGYAQIREHCNRLVRQGQLARLKPGVYARIPSSTTPAAVIS